MIGKIIFTHKVYEEIMNELQDKNLILDIAILFIHGNKRKLFFTMIL
jgi:hypothetical protein